MVEDHDEDFDDEIPKDIDLVVPHLTISKDPINILNTHHNDKLEENYSGQTVAAFAKICGRKWTYYVKDSEINVGREMAQGSRQSVGPGGEHNTSNDSRIHIDLGPSKTISRFHAVIRYDHLVEKWRVEPTGRNGLRVDGEEVRPGQSKLLRSGSVIWIAGTEMLFQDVNIECDIDQRYKDRVVRHEEEQDDGAQYEVLGAARPYNLPYYEPAAPYATHNGAMSGVRQDQPTIAPAPTVPARPVTPEPSPPQPVMKLSGKKRSPTKSRGINGMMMESTEQIDYAHDSSKDIKPACSYAAMITWAILSTEDGSLSLNNIYRLIQDHYAYYRNIKSGWQVRLHIVDLPVQADRNVQSRIRFDIIFP